MNRPLQETVVTQETAELNAALHPTAAPAESQVAVADPTVEEPGEHLIGVGVGAALGGATGAMAGIAASTATGIATGMILGGPIGGAVGLVAGAVAGAMMGAVVGEVINPSAQERHWIDTYQSEPYYRSGFTYDDYRPAYLVGIEGYAQHPGKTFEDAEYRLQEDYARLRAESRLGWLDARPAALAAWEHMANQQAGAVTKQDLTR